MAKKALFAFITIFLITNCGSDRATSEIFMHGYLAKTIGNAEGDLHITYFSNPVGSFIVEKVSVGNQKLIDTPQSGKASLGCGGIVLSAQGVSIKNQKIAFDEKKSDLTITTHWKGEAQSVKQLKYNLPAPFDVALISNTISSTTSLRLQLKQPITEDQWDSCALEFRDVHEERLLASMQILSDRAFRYQPLNDVVVSLSQLKATYTNALPSVLHIILVCTQRYAGPEKESKAGIKIVRAADTFDYELRSPYYTVNVN